MESIATHAEKIANLFPGFQSGITAAHRHNSNNRVVILTVFNRVVDEDSGLRLKVFIPVSHTDCAFDRVNLFGSSVETSVKNNEIIITKVKTCV